MTSSVSNITQPSKIRLRRASTAEWERINPILADGEPGYERGANKLKVGDGVTPWKQLGYLTPPKLSMEMTPSTTTSITPIDISLAAHIESEAPHPVYDDGPSLVLLYQNAKV